jgi:hypothetical protein
MGDDRRIRFLAYSAEYGSFGVTTFMVKRDGVLLQKD